MEQLVFLPFGEQTITIYNKREELQETSSGAMKPKLVWRKTIVPNCSVRKKGVLDFGGGFMIAQSATVVRIPAFDNMVLPSVYEKVGDAVASFFTVDEGDVIVTQEVDEGIDNVSIDNILKLYEGSSFKIKSVTVNGTSTMPLAHIKAASQ